MRIETAHRITHPRQDVLDWHERPGALVRLSPPGLATPEQPAEGGMQAGRLVGARLGPPQLPQLMRPRWLSRHTEHDGEGFFVDRQVRGPMRTWQHEHRIEADGADATVLRDSIELELPALPERLEPLVTSRVRRLLAFRARQVRDDLDFHARHADSPRLTVAITGSTGLIGSQLAALLETGGHTVRRMIREEPEEVTGPGEISWDPQSGHLDPADLEGVDVVVNLAGRSIATPWTRAARHEIRSSRINGTALIARTLARMSEGPAALVQGSAIGYYGPDRPDELLTETDPGGEGFLAEVVRDWEAAATEATDAGVRMAAVRTGVVLSDAGGSLPPQLPMFLLGLGGRINRPDAVTSWISLDDIARIFAHAVLTTDLAGPVNAVAPEPVSAREFARTMGAVLHRPALVPVPRLGPRLLLGAGAADELVRADQNVSDARLQASGFRAAHRDLRDALAHVLWR